MNQKTLNIFYWIVTILFFLVNFLSGISGLFPNEESIAAMAQLGYPAYLLIIISIAKVLGSIAILQTTFQTLKEWAYAGFAIDYIGAAASFYFSNGTLMSILFPFVFLAVLFLSHFLWKKKSASAFFDDRNRNK